MTNRVRVDGDSIRNKIQMPRLIQTRAAAIRCIDGRADFSADGPKEFGG